MTKDFKKTDAQTPIATLRDAAGDVTETARGKANDVASDATDHVASEAQTAAEAAETAAQDFSDGSLQQEAAAQLAQHLQSAATRLSATDLESAAAQASKFARENPVLFLGGAALLGFAAGRFLKSSGDASVHQSPQHEADPWTGHVKRSAANATTAHPSPAPMHSNGRATA